MLQLKSCLIENEAVIDRVFIHFVFRGDPEEAERSQVLDKLREDLENKKYLIDQHFGRPVTMVIEFRSSRTHKVGSTTHLRKTHRRIVFTKSQTKQKNLVKYILARIAEQNNWAISGTETSIEHFKPQSSGLPDAVIGQIGNLLLVPPKLNNENLADKDFAGKKQALKKAKYPIPDAMEAAANWGKDEIEAHTDKLAELSYQKIWRI